MNRVIPGLILVACWLLLLLFAPLPLFSCVFLLVGAVGMYEYCQMVGPSLKGVPLPSLLPFLLLPLVGAWYGQMDTVVLGLLSSLLAVIGLALIFYSEISDVQKFLSASVFGALYIGFCLAHIVLIRFYPQGIGWLLVLSAITAGSDTGAYYIGRAFGKRKLCVNISPGKTIEGALGGIGAGVVAAEIMALIALPSGMFIQIGFVAVLLVIIGIIGDLTESVLKRSAGVKDSGTILAGHGGVLDRGDSLLLTAPVLFYMIHFGVIG